MSVQIFLSSFSALGKPKTVKPWHPFHTLSPELKQPEEIEQFCTDGSDNRQPPDWCSLSIRFQPTHDPMEDVDHRHANSGKDDQID
jgi:hypothetical protein